MKDEREVVTILKTRSENWEFLKEEIQKVHSYECPCILKIDCDANEVYKEWVYRETIACNKNKN
ncbi:MAG: divalent cation tolerance protein CutA [Candidatus Nanoarchaeia archaeon]